jgi:DNA-binding LacI/PurR family transcriptional regulator
MMKKPSGMARLPVAIDGTGKPSTSRAGQQHIVTMWDIAKAAGVSQSTVSRVLSGRSSTIPIAPETRQRILAEAQRLRYRPNPLASGLRGARTMLLGVIVREITDPFFAGAIEAVSAESAARGYNVVLGHAHGRAEEAIALRSILETRHTDAILLLGDTSDQPRILEDLRHTPVPVVALWQGLPLEGVCTVNVDNRFGVRALVQHLAELGHHRIAFVAGRPLGDIRERRDAFIEAMRELDVSLPAGFIEQVTNDAAGGEIALARLMALPNTPTAVVASTDIVAIGILSGAHRLGLRVPDDISVVGFDDIPMSAFTVPPLTTVRMPVAAMAAVAVREAIDRVRGEPGGTSAHVLQPTLVVRESSGEALHFDDSRRARSTP